MLDCALVLKRFAIRYSGWIPLVALLGLLSTLPLGSSSAVARATTDRPDVLGVENLKPGMKGYGLTVFEGTEPQRFDVEIIDVLTNFRPRQDLILVRTEHPRLEVAKVVAGMSGSPIFIDGKMIGAYAYGWQFGAEPIAGVTPIRNMLEDLARPLPAFVEGWPLFGPKQAEQQRVAAHRAQRGTAFGSAVTPRRSGTPELASNRNFRAPLSYDLHEHRDRVASRIPRAASEGGPKPVATPLLMGGMTPDALDLASELFSPLGLEPMAAGGSGLADSSGPARYVDGGAVGVQLIRGDTSSMGLGTVTRVEGDLVSAFGHPMMNAGYTALPTAVGKVLWFLASQARSFKIGMPVRPVGALVNDRQASIVVSHQAQAPVIPVAVRITGVPGAPHQDWNFEVAHEKFMTPSFLAVALGSALQATAAERRDVTWTVRSKVRFQDYGETVIDDFGVAVGGTPEARDFVRSNLVSAVGAVLNNPWESAIVERVDVDIDLRYARELYRLRGVELLDAEVMPGQAARVRLTLVPFAGPTVKRTIKVPLPAHLEGQKVKLNIRPGYMVEKEKASPESLGELIGTLADLTHAPQSVVVSYQAGSGLAHKGHVARNLPPGVVDMMAPQSTSLAPEVFRAEEHHVTELPAFLLGQDSVTVQVRADVR